MSETSRPISLKHLKHETNLNKTLYSMYLEDNLVDVILTCNSTNIRTHRLILAANSSYFRRLFDSMEPNRCQNPVVFLNIPLDDLKIILEFMYKGEVFILTDHLQSVLKSAEALEVLGLTEVCRAMTSRNLNRNINSEANNSGLRESPILEPPLSCPHKRPRISDGIQHKTQQSSGSTPRPIILSNNLSHISPLSPPNSQLRLGASTAIAGFSPVRNIILPSEQIHRKNDSNGSEKRSNVGINEKTNDSIPVMSPKQKNSSPKSYSRLNAVVQVSPLPQTYLNQVLGNNWTSGSTDEALPSSSGIPNSSEVEVFISEESNEAIDISQFDIKPKIFELNQSLSQNAVIPETASPETPPTPSSSVSNSVKKKLTPKERVSSEALKSNPKSSSNTKTSRSSSISSQSSLPPPPSYRMVQRSTTTRLLRNIIKPTAVASALAKSKDNSEEKSNVKKDRQQPIRQSARKQANRRGKSEESIPVELECPQCGQSFKDDHKWNEHITTAHPSSPS